MAVLPQDKLSCYVVEQAAQTEHTSEHLTNIDQVQSVIAQSGYEYVLPGIHSSLGPSESQGSQSQSGSYVVHIRETGSLAKSQPAGSTGIVVHNTEDGHSVVEVVQV